MVLLPRHEAGAFPSTLAQTGRTGRKKRVLIHSLTCISGGGGWYCTSKFIWAFPGYCRAFGHEQDPLGFFSGDTLQLVLWRS